MLHFVQSPLGFRLACVSIEYGGWASLKNGQHSSGPIRNVYCKHAPFHTIFFICMNMPFACKVHFKKRAINRFVNCLIKKNVSLHFCKFTFVNFV